ncbi:MAG: YgjP-like metallopeptidase domain-containing protein [Anaerolineae bacterium]
MEQFLEPEDVRQRFYEALNNFAGALKVALGTAVFYDDTPEQRIKTYKKNLAFFHNLRTAVRHRYPETIDYKEHEDKVRKLVDTHLQAEGVTALTAPVNIFDVEAFDAEVARREGAAAKADTIAYRMKRTITEKMAEDPAFYRRFSQMIEETIKAYKEGRLTELEYYQKMQEGLGEMRSGKTADLPPQLTRFRDAPAYYGVIKEPLAAYRVDASRAADIAIKLEELVEARKVRDWAGNPDVENRIRNDIEDYLYALKDEQVKLTRGRLFVHTPNPQPEQVKTLLTGWYRRHARRVFTARLDACFPRVAKYGLAYPRLEIRNMEKRWGSCTAEGKILLNLRLIQAPKPLIDYVVMHELCHLKEHHHGAAFYALLDRAMPDWQARRQRLNELDVS